MRRKMFNHQRRTRFVDLTSSRICSELIDRDDTLARQDAAWILTGWFDRINKVDQHAVGNVMCTVHRQPSDSGRTRAG